MISDDLYGISAIQAKDILQYVLKTTLVQVPGYLGPMCSCNPAFPMARLRIIIELPHPLIDPPGINSTRPFTKIRTTGGHTSQLRAESILQANLYAFAHFPASVKGVDGAIIVIRVIVPVPTSSCYAWEDVFGVDVFVAEKCGCVLVKRLVTGYEEDVGMVCAYALRTCNPLLLKIPNVFHSEGREMVVRYRRAAP